MVIIVKHVELARIRKKKLYRLSENLTHEHISFR